jgi:Na+-transporting NADH:ubiquinone oxidoreductase subunit A
MHKGIYNARRIVSVGGANVIDPGYIDTYIGANIGDLIKDNIEGEKNRLIDGDVLSGATTSAEAFLSHRSDQISVIEEGDYYEIFGWLLPIKARPTISKTFPNFLYPNLEFDGDTCTHGEQRAFVMSGQYEQVLPMDLYPQHLLKAIMTGDFEQMEGLGIYELSEEDVALCEFVCTSKMPVQDILRGGLDMMREQG